MVMQGERGIKSGATYAAMFVLAATAAVVSTYLLWLTMHSDGAVLGCDNAAFDCDLVLGSRWSVWLGLPVSALGLCTYLIVIVATLVAAMTHSTRTRRAAWVVLSAAAVAASGAALWFIGLQAFDLESYCPYCLAVHSCGLTLTIALVLKTVLGTRVPTESTNAAAVLLGQDRQRVEVPTRPSDAGSGLTVPGIALGVCGVSVLVAGQILLPPSIEVQEFAEAVPTADVLEEPKTKSESTDPIGRSTSLPSTATESEQADLGERTTDLISPDQSPASQPLQESPPVPATEQETEAPVTSSSVAAGHETVGKKKTQEQLDAELDELFGPASPPPLETETDEAAVLQRSPDLNRRTVRLLRGRLRLDLDEQIILGSPDAPYLIAEMFDYACHHCRRLHGHVKKAQQRYGDQLAIVLLPVPFNAECNRFVTRTAKGNRASCEYVRLADAVWRTRPDEFPEFHDWMFTGSHPPDVIEARRRAKRLVGADILSEALTDPTYEQRRKARVDAYGICGQGKIPKLVVGNKVASGGVLYAVDLFDLLEDNLGIQAVKP